MSQVGHRIHHPWSVLDFVYRLADAASISLGLWLALGYSALGVNHRHQMVGAAAVIVYFLAAEITGIYRNWRASVAEREVMCGVLTWTYTIVTLATIGVLTGYSSEFAFRTLGMWCASVPVLLAATRLLVRWAQKVLRKQGYNTQGFAVVGINDLGFQLATNIENSAELGLKLVGFYDDREDDRLPDVPAEFGSRLGDIDQLIQQAQAGEVRMIYITFPMRAEERIKNVLERLSDTTASVYLVPDFFVFELLHSRWTNISGLPAVSVFEHPFYGVDGFVKRMVDICLGSLALLVAAVPMAIVALLVKLGSPGPIFFRQPRYGLDGREIAVWKFRSMTVCEDGSNVLQATRGDSRVTPLGAILRATSLDELPQLFNVLGGSMSLVGPRPHANAHNEEYRKQIRGYMLRHKVKPGITGLAQVSGWRGETDTLDKMEGRIACDHQYIREWSVWMDIKIMFRTIFVVLARQNAY